MRIPRRTTAMLAAGCCVYLAPPSASAPAVPFGADPLLGSLISGTSSWVDGTYVWTDFAYDDRGADTNLRPGGDTAYPAGMTPNNVADLIQLQLRPTARELSIRAVLETLEPGAAPVVGVAVDSDGRGDTGAAALPGSWAAAAPLGVDRLYVLRRGRAALLTATADGWKPAASAPIAVDDVTNTLTATLPFSTKGTDRIRVVSAVGYADATGASWVEGATPLHDLGFVPGEAPGAEYVQSVVDALAAFAGSDTGWQDHAQSAILAGEADPAPAVATLDLRRARKGETVLAAPSGKGLHTFIYRSALRLGEGVRGTGNATLFAGPYQPYLVWLPEQLPPGLPLVVYLHGTGQSHTSAVNVAPYSPENHNAGLNLPDALFDLPGVVAWPLGRGPGQGYSGASEQDVLDVTDDVIRRLSLDRERVMLAGLSMGGIGTFRLAELYPDRWSLAYSDVGYDSTGLSENLTSLPVRFQNGGPDYLVHVHRALQTRSLLDAAGSVDYVSFILARKHHQPAFALAECIYRSSFATPRVKNPARVRYTVVPSMAVADPASGLRLSYDGAYWVDGMRAATGLDRASVDLTSHAFPTVPGEGVTSHTARENVSGPRDFCGTDTTVQTRDAWDEQSRAVPAAPNPNRRPLVTGTLTGLSAVTVAADRAAVVPGQLSISADRSVSMTLTGLTPAKTVSVGDQVRTADRSGRATVQLPAGRSDIVVA